MNREGAGGRFQVSEYQCQEKYMTGNANEIIGNVRVSYSKYTYGESCQSSFIKW